MSGSWTVGIDVGGTKLLGVALDASSSTPVACCERPTPPDAGDVVDAAHAIAEELARRFDGPPSALGIGLPGFIGLDGIARLAPNLPGIVGIDVGGSLSRRLGCRVVADNDANCAAWASARLDAPDARAVVAVTLGTGIGGGFVLDGRLVRGAHGFAGEPGHMIVDPDGPECVCGQKGCWEVWASGTGLGRVAARVIAAGEAPGLAIRPEPLTGRDIMRLAADGDAEAVRIRSIYGGWVALGLANLVNLLDPEVIVLSGGITAEGEGLSGVVDAHLAGYATMRRGRSVEVRISTVGPAAGAVGAALLARSDSYS